MGYAYQNDKIREFPREYRRDEIREFYDNALRSSTEPRRTRKRMTVAEIKMDVFKNICKRVLPLTLAVGIGLGGLGFGVVNNVVSSWDSNSYITEQVHDFRSDYIVPNTHRTQNNEGYWYDYYEISRGIENAPNKDEAIFYCYENIGSLQTGRVIDYVGYDTFTDYVKSKGFESIEEYEDFMIKEVSLRHETVKDNQELEEMLTEHPMTETVENNSLGGK